MNKQEIIDHLKGQTEWSGNHHYILVNRSELISMIEDMNEPQSTIEETYKKLNFAENKLAELEYQMDVLKTNELREASWQDAIQFLEDHFGCEIPRNLDQVIEGFKSMSSLMNTVEFELDKQGSNLTSKEFVLEALERYKHKAKVPEIVGKDLDILTKGRLKEDLVKDICFAAYDYSQGTPFDARTIEWCKKLSNLRTMIDAIWNGYEVEEEPKYSVMVAGKYLIKMFHGRKDHKFVNEAELESWHSSAYKLTQKEIKEIDERYWTFAVPVEKV